jgi:ammonia channel protein AmtB
MKLKTIFETSVLFPQFVQTYQATVTTMVSSFGGGIFTLFMSYFQHGGKIDVLAMINGVLGSLVSVTGRGQNFIFKC